MIYCLRFILITNMPKGRLILIIILGVIVFVILLLFLGIIPGLQKNDPKKQIVTLNFWGVFDRKDVMEKATSIIPGFNIKYKEIDAKNYEADLINALASGEGPDVFMVHNSWIPKHKDKLVPITAKDLGVGSLRDLYPTVVAQDFAPDNYIYALPLWMDNLALYYNRDIFDQKRVLFPPKDWKEFQEAVAQIKETDSVGNLVLPAASIGGSSKGIFKSQDILSVLMLQTGVKMVSDDFSRATFASQGQTALNFYTDFANPKSEFYTWNESLGNSIDLFAKEKLGMMIGYASTLDAIKSRNQFINFGVANLPIPKSGGERVDYADYWGLAVSKKAKDPSGAWNFINNLAGNPQFAKVYSDSANRLPALKTLILEKQKDPFWGVFANQSLTARSWPKIDDKQVDQIFSDMISSVVLGQKTSDKALQEAESDVSDLMRAKNQF